MQRTYRCDSAADLCEFCCRWLRHLYREFSCVSESSTINNTLNTLTIAPKDAPIGRRIRSHVCTNLDECDVKCLPLLDLTGVHSTLVVRFGLPSVFNGGPSVERSSQGTVMPLTDCVGQYSSFGPSARLGCHLIG